MLLSCIEFLPTVNKIHWGKEIHLRARMTTDRNLAKNSSSDFKSLTSSLGLADIGTT